MAFFDSVELGTKLYRAAGAAPVQQEPEPIQVCRLMKKEEGIWVAASEFYAGHPDQKWVKLVSTNPGSWSIQRRVTGKQIADGLAKALAGTQDVAAKYIGTCSDGDLIQPYVDLKKGTLLYEAAGAAPVQQEPFAHLCVILTDAGLTKFFTAPSDPRGFPVYLAAGAAPAQQEPVAWRYRTKASWESEWSNWIPCSQGQYNDYVRVSLLHDWAYEAQALCIAAPAAKVPEEPRIDINDLSGMIAAAIKEQTP